MDAQLKEKWIAALESGEYKQGTGFLRSIKNEFCCLGVLCDVFQKETEKGEWQNGHFVYGESNNVFLPSYLASEISISSNGLLKTSIECGDLRRYNLAALNDTGMPFKEIAQVIREQF